MSTPLIEVFNAKGDKRSINAGQLAAFKAKGFLPKGEKPEKPGAGAQGSGSGQGKPPASDPNAGQGKTGDGTPPAENPPKPEGDGAPPKKD